MSIKISVIVPVYNTEKYLQKCLDSILNQTFREFELIVINDGSTDGSLDILKSYQKKYENIILIDKENNGQGVARNRALEICRGEYIAFADSDDYLESNMLQMMYNKCIEQDLDIAVCSYKFVDENGNIVRDDNIILNEDEIIDNVEAVKRFLTTNTIEGYSWNKIFNRKVFTNIKYPEDMMYEDIPTVASLLLNANRVGFVNKQLYNYLIRENSTTGTLSIGNTEDNIKSIYMVQEAIQNKGITSLEKEFEYYSTRIIDSIWAFLKSNKNEKENKEFTLFARKYTKKMNKIGILLFNNYFEKIKALKLIVKMYLLHV